MWEPQVAAFAKQFDVIRLDQRGFGDSELPPKPWSPVADLLSLMDQLSLEPAHLFAEASAARAAGDLDALNEAMLHLFLDGPERPRGYVAEPLRRLFLDMNGRALRVNFEKAPTKEPD